jgi:hypothetical protein
MDAHERALGWMLKLISWASTLSVRLEGRSTPVMCRCVKTAHLVHMYVRTHVGVSTRHTYVVRVYRGLAILVYRGLAILH